MSGLTSDPSFAQPLLGAATQSPITVSTTVASANTPIGTVFPGTPSDGQEFCYLADATNGVVWRFKWRAGSASSLKWECIGGTPLFNIIATSETRAAATYGALSTPGPAIALPFAADWEILIATQIANNTAGNDDFMSYDIGGTGASDNDAIQATAASNGQFLTLSRPTVKTGLTAITLTAKYKAVNGTGTFANRYMAVMPIRTAG